MVSSTLANNTTTTFSQMQTETITTMTSSSSNFEESLKAKYETIIQNYILKNNEFDHTNTELKIRVFESDSKATETEKNLENVKANLQGHVDRYRLERNEIRKKYKNCEKELEETHSKNSLNEIAIRELTIAIKGLEDKVNRFEADAVRRNERIKKMEDDLDKAELQMEEDDDEQADMEFKFNRQKSTIKQLKTEIQQLNIGNLHDEVRNQEYENTIKQLSEANLIIQNQYNTSLTTITNIQNTTITVEKIASSEPYIELENRYSIAVVERSGLQEQINIKNTLIRDLESRNKAINDKCDILFRTINELKAHIGNYETRELEFKKQIDDWLLKFSQKSIEMTTSQTQIITIESLMKAKDVKITKYLQQIATYEDKVQQLNIKIKKNDAQMLVTNEELQVKIKEMNNAISAGKADDNQIAKLVKSIEDQNVVIKGWEKENEKDDNEIAKLTKERDNEKEQNFELNKLMIELKEKFDEFCSESMRISIIDESQTQEYTTNFKVDILKSEDYLNLKSKYDLLEKDFKDKDVDIQKYRKEVEKSKQLVQEKEASNVALNMEWDMLIIDHANLEKKIEKLNNKIAEQCSNVETESSTMTTANTKITTFKKQVSMKRTYIEEFFQRYDTFINE